MGISNTVRHMAKQIVPRERFSYSLLEEPYFYRRPDKNKIKKLHNAYAGKRCFILGNGPSLNKVNFDLLTDECTFGVNGIFYKTQECGFIPTFYVVEDRAVMNDNIASINEYDASFKFFPTHYKDKLYNRKNCMFFNMNTGFYRQESPNFGIPRFSTDLSKRLYCGQSVTILNLQIAHYLGFSEVYLLGMDFSYTIPDSAKVDGLEILSTEDDTNHFHPEYFGKGKTWHDPQLEKVLRSYQMMKLVYESSNRKIFNATHGGLLEVFDRTEMESLF